MASSTSDMESELERLSSNEVVAWIGRNRPEVEPEVVKRAIYSRLTMLPDDVSVVKHFPEDFFIDFTHRHHHDEVVALEWLPHGGLDIHFWPWRLLTHGNLCGLQCHVRLCLEGIPLHAWNESISKRAAARACELDYVEKSSLDKKDTRGIFLWAWTHNPSDIPKVTWLTLSGRRAEFYDGAALPQGRGCHGLTFKVLVHLDLVEDPPVRDGRLTTAIRRFAECHTRQRVCRQTTLGEF